MRQPAGFFKSPILTTFIALAAGVAPIHAGGPISQGGGFTYQFQLLQNGQRYNGAADFEFRLWNGPHGSGAAQIGPTIPQTQTIADGASNTILLFEQPPPAPPVWDGTERWLEVRVRTPAGSANPFVALTPWQRISNAPYAAYALNATLPATYASPVNFTNAGSAFTGNGAGLTNLNAASLTGAIGSANLAGVYSSAIVLNNAGNTIAGSGAALTSLNAANVSAGNLNAARLPTGGAWPVASTLNIDADTLVVNPTSNAVGIGTAAPTFTLDVVRAPPSNNINPVAIFRQTGASASSGSVRFQNTAANHFNLGITSAGDFGIGYNANIGLAGDLLRVTSTGDVGIGTTLPTERLHVAGNARIDGAIRIPETTRHVCITPFEFTAFISGLPIFIHHSQLLLHVDSPFALIHIGAPLQIPDGALVTGVTLLCKDDATSSASLALMRTDMTTGAVTTLLTMSTSGEDAAIRSFTSPAAIAVDNQTGAYTVRLSWGGLPEPTDIQISAVRISYTITTPLP